MADRLLSTVNSTDKNESTKIAGYIGSATTALAPTG